MEKNLDVVYVDVHQKLISRLSVVCVCVCVRVDTCREKMTTAEEKTVDAQGLTG